MIKLKIFCSVLLCIFGFRLSAYYNNLNNHVIHTTKPIVEKVVYKVKHKKTKHKRPKVLNVIATIYHASKRQTDDDSLTTASGKVIDLIKLKDGKLKWIAISADLKKRYNIKWGEKVHIYTSFNKKLSGEYRVYDLLNEKAINQVDILVDESFGKYFKDKHCKLKFVKKK